MNQINSFTGQYRFLSNFYESSVRIPLTERMAKTAEHAYQACKCSDAKEAEEILNADTPGAAKRLGKKCKLVENWDLIKDHAMIAVLYNKFEDEGLKNKLINTYPMELIEGNNWGDTYWGVCKGIGENKLGKMLMGVRDTLMREDNEQK